MFAWIDSGQGKVFRKSSMLSLCRIIDWAALFLYTNTERAEGPMTGAAFSLFISMAISTFLTWIFLRTEENRSSCLPAILVALVQIGSWLEVYFCARQTGAARRTNATRASRTAIPWHTEMELTSDMHSTRLNGSSVLASESGGGTFDMPFSMISTVASPRHSADGLSEAAAKTRDEAKLRVLRKMVFAHMPEVIVSSIISLYILSEQWAELWWQTVVVRDRQGHVCDVGRDIFNDIYKSSRNGIVRRRCWGCDAPFKQLFYRRTRRLGHKIFKPYDYMLYNWSNFNNELQFEEHLLPEDENDFAIFELYHTARTMQQDDVNPWTCSDSYVEDVNDTMGFPGRCHRRHTMGVTRRQWSHFESVAGNSSRGHGTHGSPGQVGFLEYQPSLPWDTRSSFAIEYNFGWRHFEWHLSSSGYRSQSNRVHCRQSSSWTTLPLWIEVFILIGITFMMFSSLAAGISDIVVSVMVQTDFVQEHNHLVGMFYILEVLSWWPMLVHMFRMSMTMGTQQPITDFIVRLLPCVAAYTVLILSGFLGGMPRYRQRSGLCRGLRTIAGQVMLSLFISPVLLLTNLLFFDRSLTFVPLNRYYYIVRFMFIFHLVYTDATVVTGAHHMGINISLTASGLLAVMLWGVVPYVLRERENRTKLREATQARQFVERSVFAVCNSEQFEEYPGLEGTVDGSLRLSEPGSDIGSESVVSEAVSPTSAATHTVSQIILKSMTLGGTVRRRISSNASTAEESVVDILLAVGDAFEALSLACQADSPRVRRAILAVAIRPIAESTTSRQRQLLPLILPQLLLALRWRTIEETQDEQCPLSSFILDRAIACKNMPLATMVYWQLFALSTDRKDPSHPIYRAVKLRLLSLLEERNFNGSRYDDEFCEEVLSTLANQRRLYYQMRVVANTASRIRATHVEKTSLLRAALASTETFRRWHGVNLVGPSANISRRARSEKHGAVPLQPKQQRLTKAMMRVRDFLPCCYPVQTDLHDVLREEWETEQVLEKYENVRLDLSDPQGCTLPVDPTEGVIAIDAFKSFIAHSAVQPAVYCCVLQAADQSDFVRSTCFAGDDDRSRSRTSGRGSRKLSTSTGTRTPSKRRTAALRAMSDDSDISEKTRRQFYALKSGDDLRQDAFVIQIFRLMEMAWAENGLEEVALVPYGVLPVSTVEGMLAYVPESKNLSKILLECDGDLRRYINQHSEDPEDSLDRLCGSTAGYCVATYLLGIGDRHLDNVMITNRGQFFHVDFGYVLGEDPKPGAPPVRMPKEVMDVLKATGRHDRFRFLVGEAFALLRRTGRLWTAIVTLAKAAGGNGIHVLMDDEGDAQRGINLVKSRLHLELDETAAREIMVQEVEESAASMVAVMYDKLHNLGLFWH